MRAILLCAGRGSRLDPLTRDRPKCLVPVGGKPILDHQLEALRANGIEKVAIVGGYRRADIERHLRRAGGAPGVEMIFNPFWAVSSSIGSVWLATHLMEEPFCVINGDTVFDAATIGQALAAMGSGVNLVVERVAQPADDDMRVIAEADRIVAVGKRLPIDHSPLRSLGIVLCPDRDGGRYARALGQTIDGENGVARFHHDVIDHLALTRQARAIVLDRPCWQEIDRPEDIVRHERRATCAS